MLVASENLSEICRQNRTNKYENLSVTGAAGFIGANYIKYILAKHEDIKVVILDALTYAGNLGTIAKDVDNERCFFIKRQHMRP
mgnify:CR=1 FL=1